MTIPARVTGIVAARAPVCVLFRRGPSKQVLQLLWHLKNDRIEVGQWLKHRVYDDRSGVSPDGKHLIYFAGHHGPDAVTGGTYVAISKPPFFTAQILFPVGHTWSGYCGFVDDRRYWLDTTGPGEVKGGPYGQIKGLQRVPVPVSSPGTASPGGWREVAREVSDDHRWARTWRISLEAEVARGWVLCRALTHSVTERGPNGEISWMRHSLRGPEGEVPLNTGWADVWRGEVLFADAGRVLRMQPGAPAREVADLNPMTFRTKPAPYPGLSRRGNVKLRDWHPLDEDR